MRLGHRVLQWHTEIHAMWPHPHLLVVLPYEHRQSTCKSRGCRWSEKNRTNVCLDTTASLVSVLPAKTIMCVCDTSYLNVVYSEALTGYAVSFDLWVNNLKAQMWNSTRKNSGEDTAIHSSQIWPVSVGVETFHWAQTRWAVPTSYCIQPEDDGRWCYGHTQPPQHIPHISSHQVRVQVTDAQTDDTRVSQNVVQSLQAKGWEQDYGANSLRVSHLRAATLYV